MLNKNRKNINDLIQKKEEDIENTFKNADKKELEYKELKEAFTIKEKSSGRPMMGKSKTRHKIAFYVNDEQLEYLESLTNRKERTPNAVAKKLFLAQYELHNNL